MRLASLLLFCGSLASCSSTDPLAVFEHVYSPAQLPTESFSLSTPGYHHHWLSGHGAPTSSMFVDSIGNPVGSVDLDLKEALDPKSMVMGNLTTTSGGLPLQTGGMFWLGAKTPRSDGVHCTGSVYQCSGRLALGASRGRIVQQWLVEHVVLFVGASAVGLALAKYGADWITASIPDESRTFLRNFRVIQIDAVVVGCALAAGAVCGVVAGWLPAWTGAGADVTADLRDGAGRTTAARTTSRLRAALVASELALALGLPDQRCAPGRDGAQRHARRSRLRRPQPADLRLALDRARSQRSRRARFLRAPRRRSRLAARSRRAAVGSWVPFGYTGERTEFFLEGQPDLPPRDVPTAELNRVSTTYSRTLGLRALAGRTIGVEDGPGAPRVVQISESLARRYFAGRDPVGTRVRLGAVPRISGRSSVSSPTSATTTPCPRPSPKSTCRSRSSRHERSRSSCAHRAIRLRSSGPLEPR